MDSIPFILGNIFGIGFGIFCLILVVGLWRYGNEVLDDKKHDDDDDEIVIKFKIEDIETKEDKCSKSSCDD